jgi:hypothetical protein
MKKNIVKVLGVVLSLALLSSLAMVAPVAAKPGTNKWGEIDMPPVTPETGVGVMAITPDGGTIYAAIVESDPTSWSVWKTSDEGVTWKETEFTGIAPTGSRITDIAISDNYAADGTFYVSRLNGDVWRCEDEGDAIPVLLKTIVDSNGASANTVYDMDLWYDGSDNWIMVGTNLDVLVLRDALFEPWRDQELVAPGGTRRAFAVEFAPDFNTSNLIWAVTDRGDGHYEVTSTVSPGQWGMTIVDVTLLKQGGFTVDMDIFEKTVDIAFGSGYTSAAPLLYVGATDPGPGPDDGNIFMVQGAIVGEGITESTPLLPVNDDISAWKYRGM